MTNLLAVVWDFNPTFFNLFGMEVRYYGLMWALALGIGWAYFINFVNREGLSSKIYYSIFWYGVLGTVIGSRLGHCLFYEPEYYLRNPLMILAIRDGGMASHGAAIGLLLSLWLFSRKHRLPFLWPLDRVMIPVGLGGALVRLGNLFNSEISGVQTDLSWGFIFVRAGKTVPEHPTQLYEALFYLLTFFVLLRLYYGKRDTGRKHPGLMFGVGLIGVFLSRFVIEYIKNPQVDFELSMDLLLGQWLSIPFIVLGVVMIIYGLMHKIVPPPIVPPAERKARREAEMEEERLEAERKRALRSAKRAERRGEGQQQD